MRVGAWPPEPVAIDSDGEALFSVMITNLSNVIDGYTLEVLGVDPEWVQSSADGVPLKLFPEESGQVDITIRLPHDHPAGKRQLTITVRSDNNSDRFELATVSLIVPPLPETSVGLDPQMVTSGKSAQYGLIVSNVGNAPVRARAFGVDPEAMASFTFDPAEIDVAPGGTQIIRVGAQGGRAWFGQPRVRTFDLGVDAERIAKTTATFIQRPRIPRWLITLLGLLAAAFVFMAVLSMTFNRVVDDASVGDGVLQQALRRGQAGGAVIPENPGSMTGTLATTTSSQLSPDALGVADVQVELYLADDPTSPVATSVSDDQGKLAVANMGAGDYKMLLRGAGYPDVWYKDGAPGVQSPSDADPIHVDLGKEMPLGVIQVGGIPVTVRGSISGDAAGATLQLVKTGVFDPSVPALLAEVTIGADGSFTLPDIPSPASLDMIVEKPGFATVRRKVTLQPGDSLPEISIQLVPAEGEVSGQVTGPDGALGGVTVAANDGRQTVETVTYTEGEIGKYTLRNLSTPGRYTVTTTLSGFVPQTQTVVLAEGEPTGELNFDLVRAVGTITGSVRLDGVASGDVTITVTGGAGVERTIRPVSGSGPGAGTFALRGLPSPGTYTLTFSGGGAVTQVRVVSLNPLTNSSTAQVEPIDLRRERRTVRGTVVELGNIGVSGIDVVLTDGDLTRTLRSADDPPGRFSFSDVPPGVYTLTAGRDSSSSTVIPLTVEPGVDVLDVTLRLAKQASLTGRVETGGNACDLVVRLFRFGQFDSTPEAETPLIGGTYKFLAVPAPVGYLVAVYTRDSDDPLATTSVASTPSADEEVPLIDLTSACRSLSAP